MKALSSASAAPDEGLSSNLMSLETIISYLSHSAVCSLLICVVYAKYCFLHTTVKFAYSRLIEIVPEFTAEDAHMRDVELPPVSQREGFLGRR